MTATVIDALVTTLGLDSTGMKKGAQEGEKALKQVEAQSTKTSQNVSRGAKDMATAFNNVKIEIMGMLAALGVAVSMKGLEGFFSSMTKSNAALGRFATNVGMSASRLDAMRTVAEEFGDTAETAYAAVQTVASGIAEATRKGSSEFTNTARANGIALQDTQHQWLSYEQVLVNVGKRLRQVAAHNGPHGRQLALNLAGSLGVGGMFNELMDPHYKDKLDEAQRLSGVTKASTQQAEKLQRQWALVREQFRAVKNEIYTAFAPTLVKLTKDFSAFLKTVDFKKLAESARSFIEGIDWRGFEAWLRSIPWKQIWDDVKHVIQSIKDLSGSFSQYLKPALEIIGGLLALKLLTPLTSVIGLLTGTGGLVAAVGLAAAAFAGWKLGSWIESNMSQDNQDKVGRFVAMILAATGDKTAQAALDTELAASTVGTIPGLPKGTVAAPSAVDHFAMPAVNRATASKIDEMTKAGKFGSLSFTELNSGRAGLAGSGLAVGDNFDPRHAHGMGNAQFFAALEKQYGLPAGSLQSRFMRESAGGTMLQSTAGALGPMQFMPKTAAAYGLRGNEVYDLGASSVAAAKMARDLYKQFGSWDKVEASYNYGSGNLSKLIAKNKKAGNPWYTGLPDETRNYVNAWRKSNHEGLLGSDPMSNIASAQQPLGGDRSMVFNGYGSTVMRTPGSNVSPATADAASGATGTTYNIDSVIINTKATDAKSIMHDMSKNLASNRTVSTANTVTE